MQRAKDTKLVVCSADTTIARWTVGNTQSGSQQPDGETSITRPGHGIRGEDQ